MLDRHEPTCWSEAIHGSGWRALYGLQAIVGRVMPTSKSTQKVRAREEFLEAFCATGGLEQAMRAVGAALRGMQGQVPGQLVRARAGAVLVAGLSVLWHCMQAGRLTKDTARAAAAALASDSDGSDSGATGATGSGDSSEYGGLLALARVLAHVLRGASLNDTSAQAKQAQATLARAGSDAGEADSASAAGLAMGLAAGMATQAVCTTDFVAEQAARRSLALLEFVLSEGLTGGAGKSEGAGSGAGAGALTIGEQMLSLKDAADALFAVLASSPLESVRKAVRERLLPLPALRTDKGTALQGAALHRVLLRLPASHPRGADVLELMARYAVDGGSRQVGLFLARIVGVVLRWRIAQTSSGDVAAAAD